MVFIMHYPVDIEAHRSDARPPLSRRGYNDSLDVSAFPNMSYDSFIGKEMIIKCIGRRTYVAYELCNKFIVDDDDQQAGGAVAGAASAASGAVAGSAEGRGAGALASESEEV